MIPPTTTPEKLQEMATPTAETFARLYNLSDSARADLCAAIGSYGEMLLARLAALQPPAPQVGYPLPDYTADEALQMIGGNQGCGPGSMRELVAAWFAQQQRLVDTEAGWQPIDTAPKDHDGLLLTDGTVVSQGGWVSQLDQGAEYEGQSGCPSPGWWSVDGIEHPTHWIRLPAAVTLALARRPAR